MTVQPDVVTLLLDLDFLAAVGREQDPPPRRCVELLDQSKHNDGRPITQAEIELVGTATPDDLRAVARMSRAESN